MRTMSEWKKLYPLFVDSIRAGETPTIVLTKSLENIPEDLLMRCRIINDLEDEE